MVFFFFFFFLHFLVFCHVFCLFFPLFHSCIFCFCFTPSCTFQMVRLNQNKFIERSNHSFLFQAYKDDFYGQHLVWLLRGWYTDQWWTKWDPEVECGANEIKQAAGHYLATEEIIFSTSSDSKTVAHLVRWRASLNECCTQTLCFCFRLSHFIPILYQQQSV